jgi:hypothetical protein
MASTSAESLLPRYARCLAGRKAVFSLTVQPPVPVLSLAEGESRKKRAHDRRYRERKLSQDPEQYRQRKRAEDRRYRARRR